LDEKKKMKYFFDDKKKKKKKFFFSSRVESAVERAREGEERGCARSISLSGCLDGMRGKQREAEEKEKKNFFS
jgi:hypothetical protein